MDVFRGGGARAFVFEGTSNGEQCEKQSSKELPVGAMKAGPYM